MINIINKGSIFIILLFFIGCQSDENFIKEESNKSKPIEKEVATKQDRNDTPSLLSELGLYFEQDKITIDINKTGQFLESLEDKIVNMDLNITRDVGVIVSDDEVSVDLNKTKNLLDNISSFFETVINDINRSIGL